MSSTSTESGENEQKKKPRRQSRFSTLVLVLVMCCCMTALVNVFHVVLVHDVSHTTLLEQHLRVQSLLDLTHKAVDIHKDAKAEPHSLGGLSCERYGGPSPEIAEEMIYWQDIPSDNRYQSPFWDRDTPRYLTFEPDGGGWNNIRMAMETTLALAHAMGRTVVLPPQQRMYLLGKQDANQRREFSFNDFFHMDSIAAEHESLDIITMEEFLLREGVTGRITNHKTGQVSFPPFNRTNWDGATNEVKTQLGPWLQQVAYMPDDYNPDKCLVAFPSSRDESDVQAIQRILEEIQKTGGTNLIDQFVGHPVPVDGPAMDRLKENLAGRDSLCIYDKQMQEAPLIHIAGKRNVGGGRLLVHFYAFLWFENWKTDLWMKRFIRDHVRYVDELQCAAARVVHAVREHARKRNPQGNPEGLFDSFHIRRGDFQYKKTRLEADEILANSKDEIPAGSTVYVATDERHKEFFKPMADYWDVVYLDDFMDEVKDLNTNYYGMLDQLVASRGRVFFGCWFSTFTGYINRIRGYHADKNKLPGYEQGVIDSYYYALAEHKTRMREYYPVKRSFYAREFPTSWRGIDASVGKLD